MKKIFSRRNFLKKSSKIITAASVAGSGFFLNGCSKKKDFDLVIKNGNVFDGIEDEIINTDIGICGNFIREIGKLSNYKAKKSIEAKDLVVCPGFIDMHNHTDVHLLVNPKAESCIRQGITTVVSGNCGYSPFPIAEEIYSETKEVLKENYGVELTWTDIKGFFSRLEEQGIALNYSSLVGHGAIRGAAMGFNDRPPKQEELDSMKTMVRENMKNGALGLSTGLEYSPGSYALPDEIAKLCREVAKYKGVYATHMRSEGDHLLESLDESIEVARRTGVSLQISHLKIAYQRNWDKIDKALLKIEEAKKNGISIFCDRYPYIAGSTGLSFYFPLWAKQGTTSDFLDRLKDPTLESKIKDYVDEQEKKLGSWNKVIISSVVTEQNKIFEGKSVLEASKEVGKEPFDFMRDLLIEEKNRVSMITFMMSEDNLKRILAHPLVGIGTDGSAVAPYGVLGKGKPHPRLYGTYPRVLGKYIREETILSLPAMLKKMTSVPARKFGFDRRGILKPGYFADICIFDRDVVIDKATWKSPHIYPEGINYVIVNGKIVIDRGSHTNNLPGLVIRKTV